VNKEIKGINDLWVAGSFKEAGNAVSVLAHDCLTN
jgi:hypothetical protein